MITSDWPFLIITAGTSTIITLAVIVSYIDLSIFRYVCSFSPIFRTIFPCGCSIVCLMGSVLILSLTLENKINPKVLFIACILIGVVLGMLMSIFVSCL